MSYRTAWEWSVLEDLVNPLDVFLEEYGGATCVEGGPHEGVVAEAEDEEVAGGA